MPESESAAPPEPSWLAPSWRRLAVAAVIAIAGFLLPQEVPLEWYPLNNPGNDILYLEITCASDKDGDVQIFYNATRGINQLHSIYFPISPTEQTFTYTFPLLDAPLVELRLDPVANGGTLRIRQMRIIDRRGNEMRRFTQDLFRPVQQIAGLVPTRDGWAITSTPGSNDPVTRIELFSPIIAKGRDWRNLLRCLLSTGYLAMMLFILLMAVLTATWHPRGWRDFLIHAGFMAGLALLFAPVGNRGLIRNSVHFARYEEPKLPEDLRLEFDLESSGGSPSQLFRNIGQGINGTDSERQHLAEHQGLQVVRFNLPRQPISELRYDPRDNAGWVVIRGIRVIDAGQRTRAVVPVSSLRAVRQIGKLEVQDEALRIETTPGADDPILEFSPEAVGLINRAMRAEAGMREEGRKGVRGWGS